MLQCILHASQPIIREIASDTNQVFMLPIAREAGNRDMKELRLESDTAGVFQVDRTGPRWRCTLGILVNELHEALMLPLRHIAEERHTLQLGRTVGTKITHQQVQKRARRRFNLQVMRQADRRITGHGQQSLRCSART